MAQCWNNLFDGNATLRASYLQPLNQCQVNAGPASEVVD